MSVNQKKKIESDNSNRSEISGILNLLVLFSSNLYYTIWLFFCCSANDWNTAAGFPQIPVRAIATGKMNISDGTSYQFEHYYEYVDFRVDLDVDYSIFEVR
jgi:hypothetical protein